MPELTLNEAIARVLPAGLPRRLPRGVRVLAEIAERRTANSSHFRLSDGRVLAVFRPEILHDALRAAVDYAPAEDGYIYGTNATYGIARETSSGGLTNSLQDYVGQILTGGNYTIYRGYQRFDTSALPDDSVVDSADLFLKASSNDAAATFEIGISDAVWTSPLLTTQEANYDAALSDAAQAWYDVADGWVVDDWYDGPVDVVKISKTSSTYIILISKEDALASAPVGSEYVKYYTVEADAPDRPYLTVTYHEGEIIHETSAANADAAGLDSVLNLGVAPATEAANAAAAGLDSVVRVRVAPVKRAHVACHAAGVEPLLYVYDRDAKRLGDCAQILHQARKVQYTTMLPGGYGQLTFQLPIAIRKWLSAREAFEVEVHCGKQLAWAGRLTDPTWATGDGGSRRFSALGIWAMLKQRRLDSLAAETGETATNLIQRALRQVPLISSRFADWDETGFDIGGKSWDHVDIQTIINDVVKLGDDQTPPRNWDLCVWGRDEMPVADDISVSVAAANDDAYSNTSETDQSYVANMLRVGWLTTGFYGGMIFSPGLARYSNIVSSALTLMGAGETGADEPVKLRIRAELSGAPADYSGGSWPHERTLTSAYVDWTLTWPNVPGALTSPDISEVVQEWVNQSDISSSSRINIVIYGLSDTPNDTRKMFDSYEAAGANQPKLDISIGATAGMIWPFKTSFLPRRVLDMRDVDYWIRADQVLGGFNVVRSLANLENYVVARYSTEPVLYTAAAEDANSQTFYDRRDNDPKDLDAGDDATLAMAENLRDRSIEEHAYPKWLAESISVNRVYNRGGWPANPALVKAGDIIALGDYPGFVRGGEYRIFRIVKTTYDVDSRKLSISPEKIADSLAVQLLRAKQATT